MALWEFTVIVALLGALLVYTIVLTSRMGRMSAALRRIEAVLPVKDGVTAPAAAVAVPAGATAVETEPGSEVSDQVSESGRYLTMRDLKLRSEMERSRAVGSNSELDPAIARRRAETGNPFAARCENNDAESVVAESVAVAANQEGVAVVAERPSLPADEDVNDDSASQDDAVAKKEQEAWLLLSSQRRRRRTRNGY